MSITDSKELTSLIKSLEEDFGGSIRDEKREARITEAAAKIICKKLELDPSKATSMRRDYPFPLVYLDGSVNIVLVDEYLANHVDELTQEEQEAIIKADENDVLIVVSTSEIDTGQVIADAKEELDKEDESAIESMIGTIEAVAGGEEVDEEFEEDEEELKE